MGEITLGLWFSDQWRKWNEYAKNNKDMIRDLNNTAHLNIRTRHDSSKTPQKRHVSNMREKNIFDCNSRKNYPTQIMFALHTNKSTTNSELCHKDYDGSGGNNIDPKEIQRNRILRNSCSHERQKVIRANREKKPTTTMMTTTEKKSKKNWENLAAPPPSLNLIGLNGVLLLLFFSVVLFSLYSVPMWVVVVTGAAVVVRHLARVFVSGYNHIAHLSLRFEGSR